MRLVCDDFIFQQRRTLTVDHARAPASVISGVASSAIALPSNSSISSDLTPFDSRKVTFRSRGASRIAGSSRKREACSNRVFPSASCSSLDFSVDGSAPDTELELAWPSDDVSCSEGVDVVVVAAEVRCHEGMAGLFDMSIRDFGE